MNAKDMLGQAMASAITNGRISPNDARFFAQINTSRWPPVQEILHRWNMDEGPETVRVLAYITALEDAYTSLREKLPDPDQIETLEDIQNDH